MKTIRYPIICIIAILFSLPLHAQNKVQCNQGDQDSTRNNGNETIDYSSLDHKEIKEEASQDPNEIVGIDGWLLVANGDTLRWVSATQRLPYTIYFENDPEQATAAAQVVTIRMRLDPLMNMADFGIGTFGFGNHVFPVEGSPLQYQTRLDLTTEMNLYVDVVAGIDITTNEAFWIFSSIDPATGVAPTETDRGFLAVNDSTHIGEGYVTFSIKPKADLCHTGDTISAQASIVFDINDPIETNRWVNTIDAIPPVSTATVVQETTDSLSVVFSGTDDTTGIAAYRLYYTEGRSAFRLAGRYLPGDTAVLEKNPNVQYTFFSIAEDNVGNLEPMKDSPDTLFGNTRVNLWASVTPAGAAVIEGTGAYTQGDTTQLVLHPATGYRLSRWTEAGVPQGTDTLLSLVADQNHTLVAEMALQQYPLTVEAATGTTIEVTSRTQVSLTNSLTPITYSDTLNIHLSSSPCYSDVAFFLNSQPISDDTTIIVHDSVHLTSTATAHIDTGYVHDTVCPGTAYTANGFNILSSATTTPGILNFQFSILNSQNCDSVAVLSLVVRPSHTLTFLPNGGTGTMPAQHVCSGEAAVLNRATFTREGYYFAGWAATATATTPLYADGDVASFSSDQTLYALWSSSCVDRVSSHIVTVCDSYSWGDSVYTATGEYMRTKPSVVPGGCDSVYRLHLTVKHSTENLQQIYACRQYTWIDGLTYTTDTTRQLSLTNAAGCDSLITLHLALGDDVTATETIVACDTLHWHNQTFTQSTTSATATIPSIYGCDSTITLHLTLNHSNTGTETVTACDSYTWHDTSYTSTTSATITTTNAAGCDSVATLNLTLSHSTAGIETVTACNSYLWHGEEYTASTNSPTFTTQNADGCDSVVTLHLTINHCSTTEITACDNYTWHGATFTTSGVYTDGTDTLDLTINYSTTGIDALTACDSITWHGNLYTNGGNGIATYTTTNALGCDSVATLNLTLNHSTAGIETVTACNSYLWHGEEYTASTNSPTFTTQNADGCDSVVTLHLTINHCSTTEITACDSYTWHGSTFSTSGVYADGTDTLDLTINYSTTGIDVQTACDSISWHCNLYNNGGDGIATYTTTNAVGCDSVATLNLTLNHSSAGIETVTACNSYLWHGEEYTASTNSPIFTTQNADGCDSVVTLHLTINHCSTTEITACDSYTWHGSTFSTSGVYADGTDTLNLTINYSTTGIDALTACDSITWHGNLYTNGGNGIATYTTTNAAGCDSVTTLNLTVRHSSSSIETATACDSYTWNGTEYTASGMSTYQTVNSVGCDSVATLYLTINNSSTGTDVVAACDSYIWIDGITYTASTSTPTFTIQNAMGCDSVITLQLTILESLTSTETVTACDSFAWHGTTYTISTSTPTFTTTSTEGCDSTVTLNLTINYSTTATETATACDSYTWNGTEYTVSGTPTYQTVNSVGCDSVATLYLTINYSVDTIITDTAVGSYTWNGTTYTESGSYQWQGTAINGCDSTVTLMLVVNSVGVEMVDGEGISVKVYPNPTTGWITIDADDVLLVEVFDQAGRHIATHDNTNRIDLGGLATGNYMLRIHLQRGNSIQRVILK